MSKEATARSAMKLALEALIQIRTPLRINTALDAYDVGRAITALREALAQERSSDEQPAQQEPVGTYQEIMRTMIALRTGTVVQQQAYELMKDKQLYTSPPAQRKPLPDGIPSPDELEALSDGNSGMIFNTGFPTKLDRLACWLHEYAAIEAAHGIKENT